MSCCLVSETHSCNELRTRSHRYALQNFEEVLKTEEFLFLSYSEVNNFSLNTIVVAKYIPKKKKKRIEECLTLTLFFVQICSTVIS